MTWSQPNSFKDKPLFADTHLQRGLQMPPWKQGSSVVFSGERKETGKSAGA